MLGYATRRMLPLLTRNRRHSPSGKRGPLALLLLFAGILLVAGSPSAALMPEGKPGWAIAALLAFAGVHAGFLASLILLTASVLRSGTSRAGRWLAASLWSLLVLYVAIDARLYALMGLHVNADTFGNVLQPGAMYTLGISPVEVVGVIAFFGAIAAAGAWLLRRPLAPGRLLRLSLVLLLLDAGFSVGAMVARFQGVKPLLGLDVAMPLAWVPRYDEALSPFFGHGPMATDDDLQFPPAPARRPRELIATDWPTESDRRPDVLLVVFESLRPDALAHMPVLARLAEEGVRAEHHYSAGNCSSLGVFSLLTGLDPSYLGVEETWRSPVGLGALAALGYEVLISDGASLDFQMTDRVLPPGVGRVSPRRVGPADKRDRENEAWAIEWAQAPRQGPSALVLFLERTHWPYLVDGEAPPRTNAFDSWAIRHDVQTIKERYLRSAAQSDAAFGRVLDALAAAGRLESTVVVATGDHGEAFAEHGVLMHGSRLDEEQLRVPLALKLPGVAPRGLSRPSVHQDVMPTLLAYLGARVGSGPGTGVDLLSGATPERLAITGSCGISNAVGYAALLEDSKLLYQLEDATPRFISLYSRQDVPLGSDRSAHHDAALAEASRRAGALLKDTRRQARGDL